MIIGNGVDLVKIDRIQKLLEKENSSFKTKLYTKVEIAYCENKHSPFKHFASRYAAKEAFLKAIGYGMREGVSWQDIEIVNDSYGKPEIKISNNMAKIIEKIHNFNNKYIMISLSLSDEEEYAIAFVTISLQNELSKS